MLKATRAEILALQAQLGAEHGTVMEGSPTTGPGLGKVCMQVKSGKSLLGVSPREGFLHEAKAAGVFVPGMAQTALEHGEEPPNIMHQKTLILGQSDSTASLEGGGPTPKRLCLTPPSSESLGVERSLTVETIPYPVPAQVTPATNAALVHAPSGGPTVVVPPELPSTLPDEPEAASEALAEEPSPPLPFPPASLEEPAHPLPSPPLPAPPAATPRPSPPAIPPRPSPLPSPPASVQRRPPALRTPTAKPGPPQPEESDASLYRDGTYWRS